MATAPSYIIDTRLNTAQLDIFVDDIVVTTYTFDNSFVNFSERPNSTSLSPQVLGVNVLSIQRWIKLIRRNLVVDEQTKNEFEHEMKKTDIDVLFKSDIDGELLTDATYDPNSDIITFSARPERDMKYVDFLDWFTQLDLYRDSCQNF